MLLQHLERLALDAYAHISSNPQERSTSLIEEYSTELQDDLQIIKKIASEHAEKLAEAPGKYLQEYEARLSKWLIALSKCTYDKNALENEPSPIEVKNNLKADKKLKSFRKWRERALGTIKRKSLPKITPVTELECVRLNLEKREQQQSLMKKANAIIRGQKEVVPRLMELLNVNEEEATKLQTPDADGAVGFTTRLLINNNANIFRLKRRIKDLTRKINRMEAKNESKEVNGIKVVYNYAIDRIQLIYSAKPDASNLNQLKSYGWHWSPNANCWQRKLTAAAKTNADIVTAAATGDTPEVVLPPVAPKTKTVKMAKAVAIEKEVDADADADADMNDAPVYSFAEYSDFQETAI